MTAHRPLWQHLLRPSVGKKLGAAFLLFFALIAGSLISVEELYDGVADASRLVNESGRLRYFSQRLAFRAAAPMGERWQHDKIAELIGQFEAKLAEIEREVSLLPPLLLWHGEGLAAQVDTLGASWRDYRHLLENLPRPAVMGSTQADQAQIEAASDQVLAHADQVVNTLTQASLKTHRFIDLLIRGVMGINLMLVAMLFLYARRHIVAPLVALSDMVKRFAAGERDIRVQTRSRDEIGDLARAVNKSADQLNDYIGQVARMAEILEITPDFVTTSTPDCKTLSLNRAAREMFGLEAQENIVGTDMTEHFPAWAYELIQRTGLPAAIQKGFWKGETALLNRDGKEIPVSQVILAHKTADGTVDHLSSIMRDITERKAAEALLRKLSQVVEQSESSIIITARDGKIEYVNPYFCALTGYSREEAIGQKPGMWKSGQTTTETYHDLWRTILAGQTWRGELLNKKKNGALFWESTVISPVKDEKGEITHFVALKQDITARKQAEEQLRLWARAIEASVNAIVIVDALQPDYPFIYVNPAFERMTGYTAEEARGRNGRFLRDGDTDQPELEDIRLALQEHSEGRAVLRNYRKDGSLFWNELHVAPVKDEKGRITHYIGILNDVTEHKQYEEQLAYQASHDSLTRLPNRNLVQDRLAQGIIFARRNKRLLALLFIDLDNFKFINDSLGHAVGDQLLQVVSHRLSNCIRSGDTVARLGGDEFVIILADVSREEDVSLIAHKVLAAVAEQIHIEQHDLLVTCSIGVSLFPRDGEDATTLLKNADAAMYRAKEQGRNGIQYFTAEINSRVFQRLMLENGLRSALERNEFSLHYQPQVSLPTGQVVGMEALLRWHHAELGMISPAGFIPLAEDTGMIIPIGAWVLHAACKQTKAWHDAGLPPVHVAVNLSGRQFRENIPQLVEKALAESGLPAQYLELEITESVAMQHAESTEKTLTALRDMGVRLSIDDFGTGYSSLSYLKRFPLNKLKLDQSFVRDIISDPDDAAISSAIIALAHGLKLEVIAEGVETESQLEFLRSHGCDAIQGYYFSRPLAPEQMEQMLRDGRRLAIPGKQEGPARTLLLVDDEPNVLAALQRLLRHDGYHTLTASSPAAAFEILARNPVDVIVSDQRMPEMSGTEFLSRVRELYPDTVRMALSGYADLASITEAVNRGAIYKFLSKPWEDDALRAQVAEAFRYHEMILAGAGQTT